MNNAICHPLDDILNGVEEVRDPRSGTLYAVAYDAYEIDDPVGPGHYINDGGFQQPLQPVPSLRDHYGTI
jgi:hypothetical protein